MQRKAVRTLHTEKEETEKKFAEIEIEKIEMTSSTK